MFEELNLVFQRAGFLLIANAFLVASFVAVLTGNPLRISGLDKAIAVLGISVCLVQGLAAFWGSSKVRAWVNYVFLVETKMRWYEQKIECQSAQNEPGGEFQKVAPPFMQVYISLAPKDVRKTVKFKRKCWDWVDFPPPGLSSWLLLPGLLLAFWLVALCLWT